MERVTTIAELRAVVAGHRAAGRRVGLVPTMGALHAGHLSLVAHARMYADVVVVSIFVNPTQFGPGEDLDSYPRDVDGDEAALATLGDAAPELVFVPAVSEMYPQGVPVPSAVIVGGLTERLCGARRPGHFDGVGLVVTKLHNIVAPDVVVYGRKDFQQLTVIRQLVADLNQPVRVVGAPIVREADGVAMSSRNRYLTGPDRETARVLSQALRATVLAARQARDAGMPPGAGMLTRAATVIMQAAPEARLDYLEVLDPTTLQPPRPPLDADQRGEARQGHAGGIVRPMELLVAAAAFVGPARLIDNVLIGDREDEDRLLAATS